MKTIHTRVLGIAGRSLSSPGKSYYSKRTSSSPPPPSSTITTTPRLVQTSVFVQNGIQIREVPFAVEKIKNILLQNATTSSSDLSTTPTTNTYNNRTLDSEAEEIIESIRRCPSVVRLFRLLETRSVQGVNPSVAIHALNKLLDLESNSFSNDKTESFGRQAFVKMLWDRVCGSNDPNLIVEGLRLARRDVRSSLIPQEQDDYRSKIIEEALLCVTRRIFTIEHIADAIIEISQFPDQTNAEKKKVVADQFWPGILDLADTIDSTNIGRVFELLPYLKRSRDVVLKTLETRFAAVWRHCDSACVLRILDSLTRIDGRKKSTLLVMSQWISLNIHHLSENELLAVIYCFTELDFSDSKFVETLEKYVKARGVRIDDPDLISSVCDYLLRFRIRSRILLEGVGEYFIEHGTRLNARQFYSISRIFGELNFHPPNGFRFFEILEPKLQETFPEFSSEAILSLLMSFVYLERYPLNFVDKVFNHRFIDRCLSLSKDSSPELLRLFDAALRMGVKSYNGMGVRVSDEYKFVNRDHRIINAAKNIVEPLASIVGNINRLNYDVVLSSLPLHPIYIVDLMIYPSAAAKWTRFGRRTKNNKNIAVVIHTPEHYDSTGQHLIGIQALRIRHLKQMDFKVMELKLKRLTQNQENVEKYLSQCYNKTLEQD